MYYWSFPSDAKRTRQTKLEELNNELQSLSQRQQELQNLIQEASSGRQDSVFFGRGSRVDVIGRAGCVDSHCGGERRDKRRQTTRVECVPRF